MYETEHHNGLALAGLVLGILSLAIFWTAGIALLLGLIGIVVSAIALKRIHRHYGLDYSSAKAGLTTSIIGSVLALLLLIGVIVGSQYVDWANMNQWMQR